MKLYYQYSYSDHFIIPFVQMKLYHKYIYASFVLTSACAQKMPANFPLTFSALMGKTGTSAQSHGLIR